jgi:antitoxin Phd
MLSGQNGQEQAMTQSWQVQEAKARFSELVRDAAESGPQTITVRGRRAAVVLSADDYDRLKRPQPSMAEFLRSSARVAVELNIERDKSLPRDIDP